MRKSVGGHHQKTIITTLVSALSRHLTCAGRIKNTPFH